MTTFVFISKHGSHKSRTCFEALQSGCDELDDLSEARRSGWPLDQDVFQHLLEGHHVSGTGHVTVDQLSVHLLRTFDCLSLKMKAEVKITVDQKRGVWYK